MRSLQVQVILSSQCEPGSRMPTGFVISISWGICGPVLAREGVGGRRGDGAGSCALPLEMRAASAQTVPRPVTASSAPGTAQLLSTTPGQTAVTDTLISAEGPAVGEVTNNFTVRRSGIILRSGPSIHQRDLHLRSDIRLESIRVIYLEQFWSLFQ